MFKFVLKFWHQPKPNVPRRCLETKTAGDTSSLSKNSEGGGSSIKSRENSEESIMRSSFGQDAENAMSLGARTSSDLELGSSADLLSRRRVSASVEEIRNLYSALQELVPVPSRATPTPKVNQPISSADKTPENEAENWQLVQEAGKPNELQIPNENCLQVQKPRKRLLPTPPGSPRPSNKFGQAPGNDERGNGAKDRSQSPGPARKSLQGDVELEVSEKGSHSVNSMLSLRRRSTGNCLSPDSPDKSTPEVVHAEEKSRKVKLSPFVKRKLLSPFSRRRGSTPNLVIVNTDGQVSPPMKPKYSSEKSALRSPLVKRRDSLSEAISMLAKSNSIESLLKERAERKNAAHGSSSRENESASRARSKHNVGRIEKHQMELLLNSLDELQDAADGPSQGPPPTDSEIIEKLEERRGSLGTEMRELLDALKELNSRGASSPASSAGEPSSRRSSFYDCVTPTQKESLDSLEAYFHEKLMDATKAKIPTHSSEIHPNVFEVPPNVSDCHVFSDEEQTDGQKAERADLSATPLVTREKEQREFALQVNDKLEEWLTRATALSTKDKTAAPAAFEGRNGQHETGGKSSKRKIFSKRSFKRQREQNKEMYRTRRSQSLHDVFADEDHRNDPQQKPEEPVKVDNKIPANGLVVSVARSKSMQDVTNVKKKRQCKRYASHENSNTKAGVNVGSANETQGNVASKLHNHGRKSAVASHSGNQVRKQRLLPKDPTVTRKRSEELTPAMQRKSSEDGSSENAQRRRPSRLPIDLPLFYSPRTASAVQPDCGPLQGLGEASCKELSVSTPDIKKSLFPQANKRYSGNFDQLNGARQELFYINKDSESASGFSSRSATSCASHFTIDVSNGHLQNSRFNSRAMPLFYEENSRENENLQRVASHDSLPEYSDDYRDGTRSESDDSGCPGNEFNGNEIAIQTEPVSQFNERERSRENNERLETSRTLRRLQSSSRRSREVSELGVTV